MLLSADCNLIKNILLEYKGRSLYLSVAFRILHHLTPTILSEFSHPRPPGVLSGSVTVCGGCLL